MVKQIQLLGRAGIQRLQQLGVSGVFILSVLIRRPCFKKTLPLIIREMYKLGVLSGLIIIISALFIGMVVGLQGYNTLEKFGATSQLGQLIALSVTRELGPVISALLFAGRAGSALTAEIGLMKTTEQLSSMEMMAVDPLRQVIYPRLIAGFLSLPLLSIIFSVVAIYGGYLIGVQWLGIDSGTFWNNMQTAIDFRADIVSGIIKSLFFGFVVSWIALYQGFMTKPNAAGVSIATTRSVVYGSLAILGLDLILTTMMIGS